MWRSTAWRDHSWGALGIMAVVAPISNLVIAIASLLLTPLARKRLGVSILEHVMISIGIPLFAITAADFWTTTMQTNRTFAVFSTEAFRAGEVYDETFHAHARAILVPLREKLIASGRTASVVDDHSHYGVAFTVDDPPSGGRVFVLLQVVDPWLLTLKRELTLVDRIRGRKSDEVEDALVSAVDDALADLGAGSRRWCTKEDFDRMVSKPGPIDPGDSP